MSWKEEGQPFKRDLALAARTLREGLAVKAMFKQMFEAGEGASRTLG